MNRLRRNVIPDGKKHVYSQCAGLTMSKFKRGKGATMSKIARKCPSVISLLSVYMRQAETRAEETCQDHQGLSDVSGLAHLNGDFAFTSITINYNYAAKPHRDSSHIGGYARIIALGDFTGGDLEVEHRGVLPVRNSWLDFDGRALHSTTPFKGERYSLVYFAHEVALTIPKTISTQGDGKENNRNAQVGGDQEEQDTLIRQDLEALGMRWPTAEAVAVSCRVSEFMKMQSSTTTSIQRVRLRLFLSLVASAGLVSGLVLHHE